MSLLLSLSFITIQAFAAPEDIRSYCKKLKKGSLFQINNEEKVLLSKGFNVETSLSGDTSHDTRVVTITYKGKKNKKKCQIIIRDGKIHQIKT
jgi:hypothetical protein